MVQKQREKNKKETYTIQVGPLLMKALEEQKKGIAKVTYDSCKPSFYEAGEIVAKKFLGIV